MLKLSSKGLRVSRREYERNGACVCMYANHSENCDMGGKPGVLFSFSLNQFPTEKLKIEKKMCVVVVWIKSNVRHTVFGTYQPQKKSREKYNV